MLTLCPVSAPWHKRESLAHRSPCGSEDETEKRAAGTGGGEKTIRDIRRATRRQYSAEEKIRIVLDGLPGEDARGPSRPDRDLAAHGVRSSGVAPDFVDYRHAIKPTLPAMTMMTLPAAAEARERAGPLAAKGTQLPWRWNGGMISANLDVIWGLSA